MIPALEHLQARWTSFQRHQNRGAVWGAKFACLLAGFLLFYLPAQSQYGNLSHIFSQRNKEIASAKQSGLNFLAPQELEEAGKSAKDFESGLIDVSQVSSVINLVSEEAAKHNFTIAGINSESPAPLTNESGNEIERNGKKLKRIPVHIQFETNLKNIAVFLRSLPESSKRLCVLESLTIQKESSKSENLKCEIVASFFAY